MKCELVTAKLHDGSFISLYVGDNRGDARKIYKENMNRDVMAEKGIYALWQHSEPISRSISKAGHIARKAVVEAKPKQAPKKRKSSKSKDS